MMNKNHENQQVIVDQIKPPFIGVVTRTPAPCGRIRSTIKPPFIGVVTRTQENINERLF